MTSFLNVTHAPLQVIAYHGCHRDIAHHILQPNSFIPSINAYDWLGEGIYFWEYAPHRALEWAQAKFSDQASVIQVRLTLGHCLNLLDTNYFQGIQTIYQAVIERYHLEGRKLPSNRSDKRHFLDRAIMDAFCDTWVQQGGNPFQTVRVLS